MPKHKGTCNHNHHQHIHSHDGDCGCRTCQSDSAIKIIHHDDAIAASFKVSTSISESTIIDMLKQHMTELESKIKETNGLVGHMKAALIGGNGSRMFSLTNRAVYMKTNDWKLQSPLQILFTVIVFRIDDLFMETELIKIRECFLLGETK